MEPKALPSSLNEECDKAAPLSPILLNLLLDPLIRQADHLPETIPLGFADDLAFFTISETSLISITQLIDKADIEERRDASRRGRKVGLSKYSK